jgi:hypothetical protein
MSLARATDDPVLKQRYEELALEFAEMLGGKRDLDTMTPVPKRPLIIEQ